MKQLVESLNDGKPLNVRKAWDAVWVHSGWLDDIIGTVVEFESPGIISRTKDDPHVT